MNEPVISNWLDTLLNIEVFAFIGLLFWLYLKPFATDGDDDPEA